MYYSILAVLLALALVPMFQTDDYRAGSAAPSTTHHIVTADGRIDVYLRNLIQSFLDLGHDLLRFVERAARCGCHGNEHSTSILIGDKSGLGGLHKHNEQYGGSSKCHANHPFAAEKELHGSLVLSE